MIQQICLCSELLACLVRHDWHPSYAAGLRPPTRRFEQLLARTAKEAVPEERARHDHRGLLRRRCAKQPPEEP